MYDADHRVVRDQRDRHERVDPALAQHRADELDLGQVRDHGRGTRRRHAPGHAGAERDRACVLERAPEPERRSDRQLAVGAEQQDRRTVRVEHLRDPRQQRLAAAR